MSAFQQAAFCYEELLLHEPAKLAYHLLCAECQYSLHSWRAARTYYSSALQLSGGQHPRALYGIAACAAQLAGQKVPSNVATMKYEYFCVYVSGTSIQPLVSCQEVSSCLICDMTYHLIVL